MISNNLLASLNRSTISCSAYQTWKVERRVSHPRTPPSSLSRRRTFRLREGESHCGSYRPYTDLPSSSYHWWRWPVLVHQSIQTPAVAMHEDALRECVVVTDGSCAKYIGDQVDFSALGAWLVSWPVISPSNPMPFNPPPSLFYIRFVFQKDQHFLDCLGCWFSLPCTLVPPSSFVIRSSPDFSGQWHGSLRSYHSEAIFAIDGLSYSACWCCSSMRTVHLICTYLWQNHCDIDALSVS